MSATNNTASTVAVAPAQSFKTLPFEGFVFFVVECCVYTARKRLTPADLDLDENELPPAALASLGSMHSADPKQLTRFESFRGAMRAACLQYGVRCMGGFAVPSARAIEVSNKLTELVTEFYVLKQKFLADFVTNREMWLSKPDFAQWTDKIRARLDSVTHVDKQLQAAWQAFTLGSLSDLPKDDGQSESPLAAGVQVAFMSVEQTAIKELAVMATTLVENSVYDENGHVRVEATQKILSPIRKILEKADALSFAAPRLRHIVDYGRSVLLQLPTKGKLVGMDKERVFSLAHSLADPEGIIRMAETSKCAEVEISDEDALALQKLHQQSDQSTLDLTGESVEDDLAPGSIQAVVDAVPEANMAQAHADSEEGAVVFDI